MFTLSNYKDVDNAIGYIINQFYALRDSGEYEEAYNLIENNKSVLAPYFISANSFNKIEMGIYDLAQKQFREQKVIISYDEPHNINANDGSMWLKICE